MRKLLMTSAAATAILTLGACAPVLAAGAGAAAATYFDENDVCDPPTDAGVLDDDCD